MKDDQPSATARLIARSLLLLSQDSARAALVPLRSAETSGWFLESCGENAAVFRYLAGQSWFRRLLFGVEQATTPGLLMHYALRKRRIEEVVREGLAAGVQQVVVFGAGFDTLAWRLHHDFPHVAFWELDHPATQKVKQGAFAAHDPPGGNLHFVALDLAFDRPAEAIFSTPTYRTGQDTLFVAEGLLMYLEPERVSSLFLEAQKASGAGSRFVFTFLEPQTDGRVGFARPSRFVDAWLRRRAEPFRWGLHQRDMVDFLNGHGWHLQETLSPSTLRDRYLAEERPLPVVGDLIGLADWKSE